MALFGVLSLVQIVALPGYLLLRALRVGTGILGACVLSFALSLVINHFLVAGLVVLRIYRPLVMYAVFAAELILLLAVDGRWLRVGLAEAAAAWQQRMRAFFRAIENSEAIAMFALRRILVTAAVLLIGGFALSGIVAVGQIFQQWDAVVSWNRWAVDWSANRLPYATSIYPQLLPTNLSLSYVFMQSSEVWIFAKAFQFLFCLMLLLAMLDLARIEGAFGYVPGLLITYGLLVALLRFRMLSSGYVDVPLAFFALLPVYVLMLARNTSEPLQRAKYLFAGALLAAGVALTKQTGLYVAAVYPLLAWRFVLRGDGPDRQRRHLRSLARMCLIMGLLIAPWYLYKVFDFQAGCDKNNTAQLLSDFHQGRDVLQRLFHAGNMIVAAITPTGAVLLLLAVSASLRDPLQRWLVGIFVVPLGLIWAMGFSYDLRNLAVIVPWIGAAAGNGLMQIVSWAAVAYRSPPKLAHSLLTPSVNEGTTWRSRWWPRSRFAFVSVGAARGIVKAEQEKIAESGLCQRRTESPPGYLRVGYLVGLLTLLLLAACLCVSNETLLNYQRRQQRTVGVPELNRQLYAYAADHPGEATIATDYQAMRWLPELGRRSVVCTCHQISAFRQTFDRPEVRYVLVRTQGAAAEVRAFLEEQSAARFVFEDHGFAFYEKRSAEQSKVATVP
ncbi:MAG: hypothetical protein ACLP9L_12295 [Thermoguttaceae bacterium]